MIRFRHSLMIQTQHLGDNARREIASVNDVMTYCTRPLLSSLVCLNAWLYVHSGYAVQLC